MARIIRPGQLLVNCVTATGAPRIPLGILTAEITTDGVLMGGPIQQWGVTIAQAQTGAAVYTINMLNATTDLVLTESITFDATTGISAAVFSALGKVGAVAQEGALITVDVVIVDTSLTVEPEVFVWAQIGG